MPRAWRQNDNPSTTKITSGLCQRTSTPLKRATSFGQRPRRALWKNGRPTSPHTITMPPIESVVTKCPGRISGLSPTAPAPRIIMASSPKEEVEPHAHEIDNPIGPPPSRERKGIRQDEPTDAAQDLSRQIHKEGDQPDKGRELLQGCENTRKVEPGEKPPQQSRADTEPDQPPGPSTHGWSHSKTSRTT